MLGVESRREGSAMATPRQGHIKRRFAATVTFGMRRQEFIALVSGVAVTWPFGAYAQQPKKVYHIAIVHPSNPVSDLTETGSVPAWRALFQELRRLGYIEGQNLVVERYSGEGRTEYYAELAREVVRLKPDLIVAISNNMLQHFKAATMAIPIVGSMGDPVAFGLVGNLAHPGGNITGVSIDAGIEVWSKRLDLLKEAVPSASRVAFLASRYTWEAPMAAVLRKTVGQMGMSLIGPPLESPIQDAEYQRVFATISQEGVDGLIVSSESETFTRRQLIADLAEKHRLPAIYAFYESAEIGGLLVYASDFVDLWRHIADAVNQILKGAKLGDIPIYQATKFRLVVNMKAAKAIGLTIPAGLVLRADEVIE
jgi:putative ABC transport system substrate-binding protein